MSIFTTIAWISLALAFISALVIALDEVRHPQKMWIMNVVWPLTALYFRMERSHGIVSSVSRSSSSIYGWDNAHELK